MRGTRTSWVKAVARALPLLTLLSLPASADVLSYGSPPFPAQAKRLPALDESELQTTFLGGVEKEEATCMVVHPLTGEVYVGGWTLSQNFPEIGGGAQAGFPGEAGKRTGFVARFSSDLTTLIQATYLGGHVGSSDTTSIVTSLAVHPQTGDVYAAGHTHASVFPYAEDGAQPALLGPDDNFVVRLSSELRTIHGATFVGGGASEGELVRLTVHSANGDVYVAGTTYSTDLQGTLGGAIPDSASTEPGETDGYVVRLSADLTTLVQATYLGSNNNDSVAAIVEDPASGRVYVLGNSDSTAFPRASGSFQSRPGGLYDAFIAWIDADLGFIEQSAFIGGSGIETAGGLAVDVVADAVFVTGSTFSGDLLGTEGGYQETEAGGSRDGFVARVARDLTVMVQATYLGGGGTDTPAEIALGLGGDHVFVTGETASTDFPGTAHGIQENYAGGSRDAFVARLDAGLATLDQATYFGGDDSDGSLGLAVAQDGYSVYVAGWTRSDALPGTEGGAQSRFGGGTEDAMVVRLHGELGSGATLCQLECSATADPTAGAVPLTVLFSAEATPSTACSGTVSFDWDFGDSSQHSTEPSTSHIYSSGGSFQWLMTASVDDVTCTATGTVEAGPPIAFAGEYVSLIAASAHAAGAAGTNWVTDVVLHNPAANEAAVQLFLMRHGEDNSWSEPASVAVAAGSSLKLDDVVATVFGVSDGSGAITVGSDTALLISSRTYNDAEAGTYGQYIPGLPLDRAIANGGRATLLQLTGTDLFRTNIGLVNPGGEAIEMVVDLYRADGGAVTTLTATLAPYGYVQLNQVFTAKDEVSDGYATVSSTTEGATFFTYASVVDNQSGDPMFVLPVSSVSDVLYVPAAAHVAGAAGTDWRTDLEVLSAGTVQASYRIDFLPAFQDNRNPEYVLLALDAGSSVRYRDVLESLFEASGTGALRLAIGTGEVMVTSRTYNQSASLTYGQFIPGMTMDEALGAGQRARLIQLSYSPASDHGFRTNLGFASASGETTEVVVMLYRGDGTLIGTRSYTLLPYTYYQETNAFASVTSDEVDNGFAVVQSDSATAAYFAFASVVDNRSGDPIFIPARLAP